MAENSEIVILGCGNSTGVPAIGNFWGACDPENPKNARTRSSILVKSASTKIIIDTGPDFRTQLNREKTSDIDAVFYTHQHSDHTAGIDELRVLRFRNKKDFIPVFANKSTLDDLEKRFSYVLKGGNLDIYPPLVTTHEITPDMYGSIQSFNDIQYIPFEQDHGSCKSIGFRFGDTAYSVDILDLDQPAINTLKGVKNWIVDCAGYKDNDNAVHASIDKLVALNEEIKSANVFITSLSLAMDYETLCNELPESFKPCYDGQRIQFSPE